MAKHRSNPGPVEGREMFVKANALAVVAGLERKVARQRAELTRLNRRQRAYRQERQRLRAELDRIRAATGQVWHTDAADCEGCGCVSLTAEEAVAGLLGERDKLQAVVDNLSGRVKGFRESGFDAEIALLWLDLVLAPLTSQPLAKAPAILSEDANLRARLAESFERERATAAERDKLQAFKTWTHAYLDAQGVPHHPPGTHGAEGCRIGDRMDWLMERLRATETALGEMLATIHGDGGHRFVEVGATQATAEAVVILDALRRELDRQQQINAEFRRAVSRLENAWDDEDERVQAIHDLHELRIGNSYAEVPPAVVELVLQREEAQAAELTALRHHLSNLLAVIHRDGGHHQRMVETAQAALDGIRHVDALRRELNAAQAQAVAMRAILEFGIEAERADYDMHRLVADGVLKEHRNLTPPERRPFTVAARAALAADAGKGWVSPAEAEGLRRWEGTLRHYLGMEDGDCGPSVGSLPERSLPEAEAEVERLRQACAIFEKNSADAVALWEQNRRMRLALEASLPLPLDLSGLRESDYPDMHPAVQAAWQFRKLRDAALAEPAPAGNAIPDLDAIRRRNEERKRLRAAATEGQWEVGWDYKPVDRHDPQGWHVAHATGPQFPSLRPSDPDRWRQGVSQIQADAAFMAFASGDGVEADVDALLALAESARAKNPTLLGG